MNREDIIRMAEECGIPEFENNESQAENIMRFASLVASAEREACAEVCKKHADLYEKLAGNPTAKSAWAACIDNRDAIRARGQE